MRLLQSLTRALSRFLNLRSWASPKAPWLTPLKKGYRKKNCVKSCCVSSNLTREKVANTPKPLPEPEPFLTEPSLDPLTLEQVELALQVLQQAWDNGGWDETAVPMPLELEDVSQATWTYLAGALAHLYQQRNASPLH